MLTVLGMALGIGLLVFLLLRHLPLALAICAAPLPGALVIWAGHHPPLPVYGFGAGVAVLAATGVARTRIAGGVADWTPVLLAGCGGTLLMLLQDWPLGVGFAVANLCALGAAAGLRLAVFDEDAIARANRLREQSAILLEGWSVLAEPRWGWALAGAALVLAVVGWFRQPLHLTAADATGLAVLLLALLGTARDWRAALAALLAGLVMLLFVPGLPQFGFLVLPLGLGMAAQANANRRLALERAGGLASAGIAGLAGLGGTALGALLAGLVLFPALMTVLHVMFTPRRSVEQLYRG